MTNFHDRSENIKAEWSFRGYRLPADIFHGSSGFKRFNHNDALMLSKTGFRHSDPFRWLIDDAG